MFYKQASLKIINEWRLSGSLFTMAIRKNEYLTKQFVVDNREFEELKAAVFDVNTNYIYQIVGVANIQTCSKNPVYFLMTSLF